MNILTLSKPTIFLISEAWPITFRCSSRDISFSAAGKPLTLRVLPAPRKNHMTYTTRFELWKQKNRQWLKRFRCGVLNEWDSKRCPTYVCLSFHRIFAGKYNCSAEFNVHMYCARERYQKPTQQKVDDSIRTITNHNDVHSTFTSNFAKCGPIFKILSSTDLDANFWQNY